MEKSKTSFKKFGKEYILCVKKKGIEIPYRYIFFVSDINNVGRISVGRKSFVCPGELKGKKVIIKLEIIK